MSTTSSPVLAYIRSGGIEGGALEELEAKMSTLERRMDLERSATGNSADSGAGRSLSRRGFGVGGSGGGGRAGRSKRGLSKDKKSGRSFSLPRRRGRSSKRSGADGTTTVTTRDRDGDGDFGRGSDGRPSGAPSSSDVAGSGGGGLNLNGFLKDISALDVQAEEAARSGSAANDDPFARGTDGEKLLMRFRSKKLFASQRGLDGSLSSEKSSSSSSSEEEKEKAEVSAEDEQAEDRREEDLSPDDDIPRNVVTVNGDPAVIPEAQQGGNDVTAKAFVPGSGGDESKPRIRSRDDGLTLLSGANGEKESSRSDSSSDASEGVSEDYIDHEEEEEERARRRDVGRERSHWSGRGLNGAAYDGRLFGDIKREAKSTGSHQSKYDDASPSSRRSSSVPRPRRGLSLNRRNRRALSVEKPKKEQQGGTSTRSAGGGLFKSLRSLGGGRGGGGSQGKAPKSAAASIGSSSSLPPPISTIEFGVATTPNGGPAAPPPPLPRVEERPSRPSYTFYDRLDNNRLASVTIRSAPGAFVGEQAASAAPPPLMPVSEAVAHADARNASGTLPPTLSASMAAVLANETAGSTRTSVTTRTVEERAPPPPATDALTTPESLAPKGRKKTKIEKINELQALNKQLRRDIKTLHLQLREAESRASQMEGSNAALRSSRLDLLAKAEAERAKSERSTAEADELRRRYERLKDELDETLDDVDRLEEERDESRSLIKRLDREASKLSDGAEAARNEALRLAAELRAKEMESGNMAMELKIQDAELRAKDEAIEELRAELEEARARASSTAWVTAENGDGWRSRGLVERGSSASDGDSASDTRGASPSPIDLGGGSGMWSGGEDDTSWRETRKDVSERVVDDLDFYGQRETESDSRRASAARNNFRNIERKTISMRR